MRLGGSGGLSGAPPPQPTLRAGPPRLSAPTGPWPQHVAAGPDSHTVRSAGEGSRPGGGGPVPGAIQGRPCVSGSQAAGCGGQVSCAECAPVPQSAANEGAGWAWPLQAGPRVPVPGVSDNHLVRVRLVSSEDRHTHLHAYRSCITWGWPTQDPSLWLNRRRVHPARPPCRRAQDRKAPQRGRFPVLQSLTEQPVTEVPSRSPSV